jgi:hypothetical protein
MIQLRRQRFQLGSQQLNAPKIKQMAHVGCGQNLYYARHCKIPYRNFKVKNT